MNGKTLTKNMVGTAIFTALAFVISLLEFPIFPSAGFLKLDFSLVFILLTGFAFGPVSGVISAVIKELLRFIIFTSTGGIGELANFIVTFSFIIIPTIIYRYKKGIKIVIITLFIGCILEILASLFSNRFIMFPLYMGDTAKETFSKLWYFVLLFNLIKSVAVSVITMLLYKRISNVIKKI